MDLPSWEDGFLRRHSRKEGTMNQVTIFMYDGKHYRCEKTENHPGPERKTKPCPKCEEYKPIGWAGAGFSYTIVDEAMTQWITDEFSKQEPL